MSNNSNTPPDSKLILRLLGGGYLLYLAWDMRGAIREEGPLFLVAVLLFAVVGLLLTVFTLRTLIQSGYFKKNPDEPTEDPEELLKAALESPDEDEESNDECEDRTDE